MARRSSRDRRRIAEMIPIGRPTDSQRMTEPSVSEIVAGNREVICSRTSELFW